MHFEFDENHQMIRDMVREFARTEVAPGAAARDTGCCVCRMSTEGQPGLRVCTLCGAVVHGACWSRPCPRCRGEMV